MWDRSARPAPVRWPVGSDDPVQWESPAYACRRQVLECPRASRAKGCTSLHECERKCSPSGGESALRAHRRSFRQRPEHLCWLSRACMPRACSAARGLSPVKSLNLLLSSSAWSLFQLLSAFGLTSFLRLPAIGWCGLYSSTSTCATAVASESSTLSTYITQIRPFMTNNSPYYGLG